MISSVELPSTSRQSTPPMTSWDWQAILILTIEWSLATLIIGPVITVPGKLLGQHLVMDLYLLRFHHVWLPMSIAVHISTEGLAGGFEIANSKEGGDYHNNRDWDSSDPEYPLASIHASYVGRIHTKDRRHER